ncbi:MAG: endonuclease III [Spirochaetes bacterium]|nr:endonuclease III [Spirochaetota bacterium]
MTKQLSDKILKALIKHYPDVKPDLKYGNLYQLTVAVILSAQTTDRQVNAVTGELFKAYPDFASLARARLSDVRRIVRSTGFYRNKAKNIVDMAQGVIENFNGRLPGTREELVTLPGIGRKSANVILSIGFGVQALAVDTHIIRIANRLAYADSRDPRVVEQALTDLIPERLWTHAHLLLIRHGRATCRARKPLCGACPVSGLCASPDKTA